MSAEQELDLARRQADDHETTLYYCAQCERFTARATALAAQVTRDDEGEAAATPCGTPPAPAPTTTAVSPTPTPSDELRVLQELLRTMQRIDDRLRYRDSRRTSS